MSGTRDPSSAEDTLAQGFVPQWELAVFGIGTSHGYFLVGQSGEVTHKEADACLYLGHPKGTWLNKQHKEKRAGAFPSDLSAPSLAPRHGSTLVKIVI
jgi:hypothetical protein